MEKHMHTRAYTLRVFSLSLACSIFCINVRISRAAFAPLILAIFSLRSLTYYMSFDCRFGVCVQVCERAFVRSVFVCVRCPSHSNVILYSSISNWLQTIIIFYSVYKYNKYILYNTEHTKYTHIYPSSQCIQALCAGVLRSFVYLISLVVSG